MKIVVWNMEWLNDLFMPGPGDTVAIKDGGQRVRGPKPPWQKENTTVAERLQLIGSGLIDLDADIVVIVEGPNRSDELQLLFDTVAPGDWLCHIQPSRYRLRPDKDRMQASSQCIGVALRLDRGQFADDPLTVFDSEDPASGLIFDASQPFFHDIGEDDINEWFRFERKPLYVQINPRAARPFRIVGLHLKSKGVFGAYEWSKWWQLADANRARLLAQCRQFRKEFLDPYLTDPETRDIPLIVCGDINDGPGFDTSEIKLKASGVETLMGNVWHPALTLRNALFDGLSDKDKRDLDFEGLSTTRFADPIFNDQYHRVWIDHILYSDHPAGKWVSNARVERVTGDGLQYWKISDHFPVSATVDSGIPTG